MRGFFQRELARRLTSRYLVLIIMIEWSINIREDGMNLLDSLVLRVPSAPRGFLRQLCKKKRIILDDQIASAEMIVRCGETIKIRESQRVLEILSSSPIQPEQILYEDTQCMVINKPAGLAIHRAKGHDDNLLFRVQDLQSLRKEHFQIALINRLDKGTSGIVLIGKGKESIRQLGKLIMSGAMTKRYLALVHNRTPHHGRLDLPVSAKGRIKNALTRYQQVEATEEHCLLMLELETGRQHQIRQQLAAVNHPIVGDKRYSTRLSCGAERTMLHSFQLIFTNPATDQEVNVTCPPTDDFFSLAYRLGLALPPCSGSRHKS